MTSRIALRLDGGQAKETAQELAAKLGEFDYEARAQDSRVVLEGVSGESPVDFVLDPNDPPGFAADKILDALEQQGLVALDDPGVSDEEEAKIEDRLRRLGYLE